MLTSDSDPIEVWLVTNNDPVQKSEADTADRMQLPLPPQPPQHQAQVIAKNINDLYEHAPAVGSLHPGSKWHAD